MEWLYPSDWNQKVVVWLDSSGRQALLEQGGTPTSGMPSEISELLSGGSAVVAADLFHLRESAIAGRDPVRQRTVKNPREFAGYTFGYNAPAIARSVQDVLTILAFLRNTEVAGHPRPSHVAVAGFGEAAPIVLAARSVAGSAIDRTAVDTGGFRFEMLDDWRHPLFLPGAVRYLDVPGLIVTGTSRLRLAGEKPDGLLPLTRAAVQAGAVSLDDGSGGRGPMAAWLVGAGG